ncbi:uncharacterized protein LOC119668696 isoform X2 [Teleopsis dalmanni]|uniref:uncharacterized protein LOC119668694 isoform X2 n=1 Tax=Teleopsis dalmanni TaxID=139649 RepID=UPI0018CD59F3|nr:uncharacterized protein LOC119668694 isoform X2 [Teleopsis dalmanni]XP_037934219.1 uncharacterized protein LOC119668696 isoform X2 [Teleopsis dalmanni]
MDMHSDLEYIPGDFTSPRHQHSSRELLLRQKYERDKSIAPELPLHKFNLERYNNYLTKKNLSLNTCSPILSHTSSKKTPFSPPVEDICLNQELQNSEYNMIKSVNSIADKPNERCPSPIVPAYANFELAKRMHSENLDHQPLPDCVADLAYRKLQISGGQPGLGLEIDPVATGVGMKSYKAGPTHCTKLKVYRPKTCGVVPRSYNLTGSPLYISADQNKKMSAMDLAICWDYTPLNPNDEPQRAMHIDGSNDSAGPAVFTHVKTPREDVATSTGRSAGVFNNTLGEASFFDKDILSRKTDFIGKNLDKDDNCVCDSNDFDIPHRSHSVSNILNQTMPPRYSKQYQSTSSDMTQQKLKALRKKYLGTDDGGPICLTEATEPACKRSGFFRRARSRLCHKVAPQSACCPTNNFETRYPCKSIFRIGNTKYNRAVLVIPRPRNPYKRKNYSIDTLVPPFTSYQGGAGQGGYPEHWRLASVYQHAYKPLAQRRKPLLQTVYK